jgi:hypothetical protein
VVKERLGKRTRRERWKEEERVWLKLKAGTSGILPLSAKEATIKAEEERKRTRVVEKLTKMTGVPSQAL